jgi:hypothetical protein
MNTRILLLMAPVAALAIWIITLGLLPDRKPTGNEVIYNPSFENASKDLSLLEGRRVKLDEVGLTTDSSGRSYMSICSNGGHSNTEVFIRNPCKLKITNADAITGTIHHGDLDSRSPSFDVNQWTIDVELVESPIAQSSNHSGDAAVAVLLAAVIAFGSGVAFFRWRRRARAEKMGLRHYLGQCTQCGYDLRESKDRCPECGHPIENQSCGGRTRTHKCVAARG